MTSHNGRFVTLCLPLSCASRKDIHPMNAQADCFHDPGQPSLQDVLDQALREKTVPTGRVAGVRAPPPRLSLALCNGQPLISPPIRGSSSGSFAACAASRPGCLPKRCQTPARRSSFFSGPSAVEGQGLTCRFRKSGRDFDPPSRAIPPGGHCPGSQAFRRTRMWPHRPSVTCMSNAFMRLCSG
jgi:hypothetical protein